MNNYNELCSAVEEAFGNAFDLVIREISTEAVTAKLYFLDGMADSEELELTLLRPLILYRGEKPDFDALKGAVFSCCNVKECEIADCVAAIAAGDAALLVESASKPVVFAVRKGIYRAVTEPPTSTVIKGPREGFVENLKVNTVLLRRRLRTEKLKIETLTLGRFSETAVAICYIDGIVKKEIVSEVRDTLSRVDIDGLVDSSYVTKILEKRPYSMFKQIGNSEKPDIVSEKLLDGRLAIIVDGSPIVLTLPFLLIEDFDGIQDLYKRSTRASFLRTVRVFAIFMAVVLPAVYVAMQLHQYQILPLQLLIKIMSADKNIPFSPTVEMLIALLLFEILGEASIRMPRHVSMALSVVGAIVLGETAVNAGLLSSVTVLIVALSGIGLYAVPDEVGVFGILRVIFVILAGLFGIYGLLLGLIALFAYLNCLETFSVSYLAPFAPIENEDLRNTFLVSSYPDNAKRTAALKLKNKFRIGGGNE